MSSPYLLNTPIQISFSESGPDNIIFSSNEMLQKTLYHFGPHTVTLDGELLQDYDGSSILDGEEIGLAANPSHMVIIVGYDMDPQTKRMYWILKNSWGSTWGNFGFFAVYFGQSPHSVFYSFSFVDNFKGLSINLQSYGQNSDQTQRIDFHQGSHRFGRPRVQAELPPPGIRYSMGFNPSIPSPRHLFAEQAPAGFFDRLPPVKLRYQSYLTYTCEQNRFGRTFNGPVRNQGRCGVCWIFSCTQVLSTALSIKYFHDTGIQHFIPLSTQLFINHLSDLLFHSANVLTIDPPPGEDEVSPCDRGGIVYWFLGLGNGQVPLCRTLQNAPVGVVSETFLPYTNGQSYQRPRDLPPLTSKDSVGRNALTPAPPLDTSVPPSTKVPSTVQPLYIVNPPQPSSGPSTGKPVTIPPGTPPPRTTTKTNTNLILWSVLSVFFGLLLIALVAWYTIHRAKQRSK